jgi:amidase
MDNLYFLTASQLADCICKGEISSLEVTKAFLDQISRHNPKVNAIITLDHEQALRRARLADEALLKGEIWGPLHGVPITIKDVFETEGLRTTSGFQQFSRYVPKQDAAVVARLRSAGAIILGKTNTPPMANDDQTNNPLFGRTNNPWNLERTPGGSSGGSAAAIASGFSALDIGSDIGGSVRNPAAFCGTFSLKPTDTLVPFKGHIPPPPGVKGRGLLRYFLTPGPIARSVEDLRLALKIIAGPLDDQWEIPPVNLDSPEPKPLSQLKIAWCDDFGLPVSSEIHSAIVELVGRLSKAGCLVERCVPTDFDFNLAIQGYGLLKQAAFSARETPLHLPRFFWRMASNFVPDSNPLAKGLMSGAGADIRKYAIALSQRDGFIAQMEKFLMKWDAWICPVAACTAYPHLSSNNLIKQLSSKVTIDGNQTPYILATSVYTSIFNLTGSPVVVLPLAQSCDGMPIGIQMIGKRWKDMDLLNVAETITEITGPFKVPPGY